MNELKQYAQGLGADEEVILWLEKRLPKDYTTKEAEHIIDYMISDKRPNRIERMTWEQAKSNTDKWNKSLQKKGQHIQETKSDIEIVLDFKDGFKIVKLVGQKAYEREGYLMRHCVATYYNKDVEIYSLRDKNNNPHCTIEKDVQIKGKGNGDIHPKYINYIVQFLESTGMKVRDSEMKNLGYTVPKFYQYTINKKFREKYVRKNEEIVYKKGYTIINSVSQIKKTGKFLFDNNIIEGGIIDNLYAVSGYIHVCENSKLSLPKVTTTGNIDMSENSELSLPKVTTTGGIEMGKNSKLSLPKVTTTKNIFMYNDSKLSLPKATTTKDIYMYKDSKLSLPKVTTTGNIYMNENSKLSLPKATTTGNICMYRDSKLSLPKVTTTKNIFINENSKLSLPKATTTGNICMYRDSKLSLPKVTTTGNIDMSENSKLSLPKVTTTGNIDMSENSKLSLPKVTTTY